MAARLITITSTFPSYLARATPLIVYKLAATRPSSSPLFARPDSSGTEVRSVIFLLHPIADVWSFACLARRSVLPLLYPLD